MELTRTTYEMNLQDQIMRENLNLFERLAMWTNIKPLKYLVLRQFDTAYLLSPTREDIKRRVENKIDSVKTVMKNDKPLATVTRYWDGRVEIERLY